MTKYDLVSHLIKLRLAHVAELQGCSPSEAQASATQGIRESGLTNANALATPEGTIVTLVENILFFTSKGFPEKEAIEQLETYRSSLPGSEGFSVYPKEIHEYVYYRLNVEMPVDFGYDSDTIGLDEILTRKLTTVAIQEISSGKWGVKSCFIATACFGSADDSTVLVFRRYREKTLKKTTFGRKIIYMYYKASPACADFIEKHDGLRKAVRCVLATIAKWI